MSRFLAIMRHTPESCPIANERTRKLSMSLMQKMPELLQKHGVKLVSSVSSFAEHAEWNVFEAPSADEIQKAFLEPGLSELEGVYTMELKPVFSAEESLKIMGKIPGLESVKIPAELVV